MAFLKSESEHKLHLMIQCEEKEDIEQGTGHTGKVLFQTEQIRTRVPDLLHPNITQASFCHLKAAGASLDCLNAALFLCIACVKNSVVGINPLQ